VVADARARGEVYTRQAPLHHTVMLSHQHARRVPRTTAGVATQAAEVTHSIAVVNRTSLAYMSPATDMHHRMVQVAFKNLRKLHRLHDGSGVGENDHVPFAPFFHKKRSHERERVSVCTCASAADNDGKDASEQQVDEGTVPAGGQSDVAGQGAGSTAVAVTAQVPSGKEADAAAAAAADRGVQNPSDFEEGEGEVLVRADSTADFGAAVRVARTDKPGVDNADWLMVLRHTLLLAELNASAATRPTRHAVLDTRPVTRAQLKLADERTSRPLSKGVRPTDKARILLCGSELHRLRGESWLTEELMNFYAALIDYLARAAAGVDREVLLECHAQRRCKPCCCKQQIPRIQVLAVFEPPTPGRDPKVTPNESGCLTSH